MLQAVELPFKHSHLDETTFNLCLDKSEFFSGKNNHTS